MRTPYLGVNNPSLKIKVFHVIYIIKIHSIQNSKPPNLERVKVSSWS